MSVENLAAMRNCGAELVVLEVFNVHPMSRELIKKAAEALAGLAQDDQMRENMIGAGAVEKIVDAIDIHLAAEDVVEKLCETLCVLANSQDACTRISTKIANLTNAEVSLRIIQAISSGSNCELVTDEDKDFQDEDFQDEDFQDKYIEEEERIERLISHYRP